MKEPWTTIVGGIVGMIVGLIIGLGLLALLFTAILEVGTQ